MKNLPDEIIEVSKIKEHPKNYRDHHEDQILHIMQSIKKHGVFKNVVIAKDNTLLGGHGVLIAAKRLNLKTISVKRVNVDPDSEEALEILIADNEISRLGMVNDRSLSELLKVVKDKSGLLGTGYDEMMLANLVMVTRHESEIKDINEAAEWVGMPAYEEALSEFKVTVNFKTEKDRDAFLKLIGQPDANKTRLWWPARKKSDMKSVRFE